MNIKHLVNLSAGHPFRESIQHAFDGDTAVVQLKDVDPEKGLDSTQLYRVHLTGRKSPDYLQQGDILFVGRGYRIFAVLVDQDLQPTVAGSHFFILRVRPNNQDIRPDYLVWYINHKQAQRYFAQHVAGSALPHVTRTTLENLPVLVPPLAVQEHIVKLHHCRLKEKALLEKLIEKKKQLIDGLLDKTLEQYQEDKT
ncbi:MAG: restriction endonuclease subunit S [Methylococcales bacterium]|jgi:restriction endonuclease S subunit